MKKKPYRYILYLYMRAGVALIRLLPRSFCLLLARFAGRIVFFFLIRHKTKTVEHLKFAFGQSKSESELKQIARDVFINLALNAIDWCKWPQLSQEERARLIIEDPADGEKLKALWHEGRGLIFLASHVGNWEILGSYLAKTVCPFHAVGKQIYYEPFNRAIVNLRKSWGVETIYSHDSPKEILKILKHGGPVGMLSDQDVNSFEGVFVPFFGRPAYTPTGPVRIALATGAPLAVVFLVREGNGYRLILKDVVRVEEGQDKKRTVKQYTSLCAQIVEQVIRQYPEQWVWMHDRWKTRPAEETVVFQEPLSKEAHIA